VLRGTHKGRYIAVTLIGTKAASSAGRVIKHAGSQTAATEQIEIVVCVKLLLSD
jgi:hypothetical protein